MMTISNAYPRQIWVAVAFLADGSGDDTPDFCVLSGKFAVSGWFHLQPGESKGVFDLEVGEVNKFWLFYAKSDDGTHWTGSYHTQVTDNPFNKCWNDPGDYTVGFFPVDVNNYDDWTETFFGR